MEEVVFKTENLSRIQKIALMERLWEELSADDEKMEPPVWHQEILDAREDEWEKRDELSEDWEVVKKRLRGASL